MNPADNITKFEVLPKLTVIDDDGGVSTTTLTLKYDRAIRGVFGVNVEVPLARFESPFGSSTGVSDVNVRGRYQRPLGSGIAIVGVEGVLPVASDTTLGSGKFQVNPTVVYVQPLSRQVFVAAVAKHSFSVAGDSARDDIRVGLYRLLGAYSSPQGWWTLVDPQVFVDYAAGRRVHVLLEGEVGRMVGPMTGVWIRGGGRIAGGWRRDQWSISTGVRFISF